MPRNHPPKNAQNSPGGQNVRRADRPQGAEKESRMNEENRSPMADDAYTDTVESTAALLSRHADYAALLSAFAAGDARVAVQDRRVLRAIDEGWVKAIEDALPAIDTLLRHPTGFIAESEEVLPIEMTKKVNGRSIAHLARHSDYLSEGPDGEYTPTKLLNIFREDSLLTYENKFLNTLLARLALFVGRRYTIWRDRGADERVRTATYDASFPDGDGRAKITLTIERTDPCAGDEGRPNPTYDTALFRRVTRLREVTEDYLRSDFARKMDRNYVHPPIMRTNAILKNKYFRTCLSLWEFIESYEDAGYGLLVGERNIPLSDDGLRAMQNGAAAAYCLFRHDVCGDAPAEEPARLSDGLRARVDTELPPPADERNTVPAVTDDMTDAEIVRAVYIALLADEMAEEERRAAEEAARRSGEEAAEAESADAAAMADEPDDAEDGEAPARRGGRLRIERSFLSYLHTATPEAKLYLCTLANLLTAYPGVRARVSWDFLTFRAHRRTVARLTLRSRVVRLYLACDPAAEGDFPLQDVSATRRTADTPALLRVGDAAGLRQGADLIARTAALCGLGAPRPTGAPAPMSPADYPPMRRDELIAAGLIRCRGGDGEGAPAPAPDAASAPTADVPARPVRAPGPAISAPDYPAPPVPYPPAVGISPEAPLPAAPKEESAPAAAAPERVTMRPIVRPTVEDFSEPTLFGVDDSGDFLADMREEERRRTEWEAALRAREEERRAAAGDLEKDAAMKDSTEKDARGKDGGAHA